MNSVNSILKSCHYSVTSNSLRYLTQGKIEPLVFIWIKYFSLFPLALNFTLEKSLKLFSSISFLNIKNPPPSVETFPFAEIKSKFLILMVLLL